MRIDDFPGGRVLFADDDGPPLSTEGDAVDLLGEAFGAEAEVIVIPVGRFDPAFFDLSTRLAGHFAQKLVNYRVRLVVLGDVSAFEASSSALRDWIRESNTGSQVWFVRDEATLAARLAG